MKIKFKWYNRNVGHKDPFNGEYLTHISRVPNIGERVCFDKTNTYKVVGIITELKGWQDSYIVQLDVL